MRTTIVVLEIRDDRDDRSWERALRLPPCFTWNETLAEHDAYVKVRVEFDRKDVPLPPPESDFRLPLAKPKEPR